MVTIVTTDLLFLGQKFPKAIVATNFCNPLLQFASMIVSTNFCMELYKFIDAVVLTDLYKKKTENYADGYEHEFV